MRTQITVRGLLGALFLLGMVRENHAFVSPTTTTKQACRGNQGSLLEARRQQQSCNEESTFHLNDERKTPALSRRHVLSHLTTAVCGATAAFSSLPQSATARWVLDEDTGDYVEVEDVDWQTAWKQRIDKASVMSPDEILAAARGAGNRDDAMQEESPAARKRRALSACRSAATRAEVADGITERDCTVRVLNGEWDFILK